MMVILPDKRQSISKPGWGRMKMGNAHLRLGINDGRSMLQFVLAICFQLSAESWATHASACR